VWLGCSSTPGYRLVRDTGRVSLRLRLLQLSQGNCHPTSLAGASCMQRPNRTRSTELIKNRKRQVIFLADLPDFHLNRGNIPFQELLHSCVPLCLDSTVIPHSGSPQDGSSPVALEIRDKCSAKIPFIKIVSEMALYWKGTAVIVFPICVCRLTSRYHLKLLQFSFFRRFTRSLTSPMSTFLAPVTKNSFVRITPQKCSIYDYTVILHS